MIVKDRIDHIIAEIEEDVGVWCLYNTSSPVYLVTANVRIGPFFYTRKSEAKRSLEETFSEHAVVQDPRFRLEDLEVFLSLVENPRSNVLILNNIAIPLDGIGALYVDISNSNNFWSWSEKKGTMRDLQLSHLIQEIGDPTLAVDFEILSPIKVVSH